jgi:hypothetical protein
MPDRVINKSFLVLHRVYTLFAEARRSPDVRVKAGQELEATVALDKRDAEGRAGAAHEPCFVGCLLCACAG